MTATRPDNYYALMSEPDSLAESMRCAGIGTYPVARALRDAATYYRIMHDMSSDDGIKGMYARYASDAEHAAQVIQDSTEID